MEHEPLEQQKGRASIRMGTPQPRQNLAGIVWAFPASPEGDGDSWGPSTQQPAYSTVSSAIPVKATAYSTVQRARLRHWGLHRTVTAA